MDNSNSPQHQAVPSNILIEREGLTDSFDLDPNDSRFQASMLEGVSRTFALTIPQLPSDLRDVVSNAYLLCRIVDTIEDEPGLVPEQKKKFCDLFLDILEKKKGAEELSRQLTPLLTDQTIPTEHALIREVNKVVAITWKFKPEQQDTLIRCVRIMSEGMIYFQAHASKDGLEDQAEMDKYCYHVAGVVGEMLTELFSYYSLYIAKYDTELLKLSVSFGQGLQMTNILKDIWDDQKRGACWLPKDLFERKKLRLNDIITLSNNKEFQDCLRQLIGIAHAHLENALKYTLMIPKHEKGIRNFCLWALGMALLTLRKINGNLAFTDGKQVKISRRSVKATVLVTGITVKNDTLLKLLFKWLGRGLS